MMSALDKDSWDEVAETLGEAFAYAIDDCHLEPNDFNRKFIESGIADEFASGHPKYVFGMSGIELAQLIIRQTSRGFRLPAASNSFFRSCAYWTGWILALYQLHSGLPFDVLYDRGLTAEQITSMYILHEADETKFFSVADQMIGHTVPHASH